MEFRFWPKRFVDDERSNLGNVLLKMSAVTEEELNFAVELQKQKTEQKLGELLIEMDALTPANLEKALEFQQRMRSGKAADAMLEIVENRTERQRARLSETVAALSIILPVLAVNMVGVGYVVFNEDLEILSAVAGPLNHEALEGGNIETFRGLHVDELTRAWVGQEGGADEVIERFRPYYEKTLAGETTEMLFAANGQRTRMVWAPVEVDGQIRLGIVLGQTIELLVDAFNTPPPEEDTAPNRPAPA